ncbi:TadE/TadG family type IV pilus assembly protein [Pseudaminobacter soli (ex Li et al. 2025)]|uniref:TadE/TadG family type IV pilus assembly protein n=1 Tax=Pseudaminobacter soli (ex Li et al. 2025) TaxID=1295366 RepID=UPI0024769548|nr:pilus assembly protein [Mesorhizobium soli]
MSRFRKDDSGASMVEFTLVFPMILLVTLGTVDATLMLYDWACANKAAYRGARMAVISAPVATGITTFAYDTNPTHMGDLCFSTDNGQASVDVACPTVTTRCTFSAKTCSGGQIRDAAATTRILGEMQRIFPRLTADNVEVEYRTNGLGFYGRPGGLPMDVTVRIRCMSSQFFFLGALMGWAFPALPAGCPAGAGAVTGPALPAFSSTLPSEGMGAS